jgi:hypothetical protein
LLTLPSFENRAFIASNIVALGVVDPVTCIGFVCWMDPEGATVAATTAVAAGEAVDMVEVV